MFVLNIMAEACIVVFSIIYAFAVSITGDIYVLAFLAVLPLILLFRGSRIPVKLNIVNALMVITLALTWPVFREGLITGIIIALRVNMIYVVFASFVFQLGAAGIYKALVFLHIPEKLRVLMLLTLRGIYILQDRFDAALTSLRLRAPEIHGLLRFKTFAYITGSVLLQSSQRSEKMLQAIKSRGGFGGFIQ